MNWPIDYDPHPSSYKYAADQLGVKLEEVMLVAPHAWDMAGALRAGAWAAFIARPGQRCSTYIRGTLIVFKP